MRSARKRVPVGAPYLSSVGRCGSLVILFSLVLLCSCSHRSDPNTVVMLIESSPSNLDPRIGTDAQSERLHKLIFDSLVRRDEHFQLQPELAERWEVPDPLTYIFHLRAGVKFHDGRPLTSADVKYTLDTLTSGKLRTARAAAFKSIARVDAPDPLTVIVHLTEPNSSMLWNFSDGALGIIPAGSSEDLARHPIGSGPFRFVSAVQDREVVLERNPEYWQAPPNPARVRFQVVPDATTRALELRKGTADVAINAFPADTVVALMKEPKLEVERAPGTIYTYLALNLRDPVLRDVRVRQALAYAIDRETIIHYLLHGMARPASSVLPPESWAFDPASPTYAHDPARARKILDDAGYKPARDGIRFRLEMKTSTDESTRLLAAVLQQQFRDIGVALDIRSYEFATFYSDVTKGAFQLYSLRWIGGNEDPDIFESVFDTASFAPRRANRSYYSNPEVDRLIADARATTDQNRRKSDYVSVQQIVGHDLPYINLWYLDNTLVHSRRMTGVHPGTSGNYDFLRSAKITD